MTELKTPTEIAPLSEADRPDLIPFLTSFWRSERMVARGKLFYPAQQEGFIARKEGAVIGLVTFEHLGEELELTLLDSRDRNQGIGTLLVEQVLEKARQLGCRRVWTVITNDNIRAFRFYQKRGFDLIHIHLDGAEANRKIKPEIPATGQEGIPIRHELEFEYNLR